MNNMREDNKTALMNKFRQKYKNVDVLLIDDIQFIEGKKKFMDELFDIFEALKQKNKQIVLTSDRLPRDIPKIPDRLRTRFEGGIVVDIEPPSFETRIEILKKWSDDLRLNMPEDVVKFIAQNFDNNVRELEGAFNKVTAIAEIEKADITLDFAQSVLKIDTRLKTINIDTITKVVADFYNFTVDEMKSPSKVQKLSDARKYVIYLAREMTNMTYEEIGKFFNKKHSTMMYSYEILVEHADRDTKIKETIRELKQAIKCSLDM
jgi:chromosomal replication initiator protein